MSKKKIEFPPLVKGSCLTIGDFEENIACPDSYQFRAACALAAAEWEDEYWKYNDYRTPIAFNNQQAWHAFRREHCKAEGRKE